MRTNVARAQHGEMRSINFHFRFLFWLRCFVDNVINFIYLCMKRNGLFSIDVSAVEGSMLAKRLAACTYLSSIVSELYDTFYVLVLVLMYLYDDRLIKQCSL